MQRLLAPRLISRRTLPVPRLTRAATSFQTGPSPPKLPAEEQAEFERLQREASVSQAFQPQSTTESTDDATQTKNDENKIPSEEELNESSGALFRGAKPEFEGDTNPRTGEVGGPKNEPLRWGSGGDWSYNGRATDFRSAQDNEDACRNGMQRTYVMYNTRFRR